MTPSPAAAAPSVTFADLGLPVPLVQALRRDGIEAPFPIQAATVPDTLAGKDVLGRGPTGSGKTLAFGLPMLARLAGGAAKPGRPRGLVLVPTRELAAQIERALDEPALALGLRIASVVGGAPIKRQADRLARGVDLLIATPGRLQDLILQGSADLSDVLITALDEADHMADMGFLPQVTKLLDRTPKDGQRLLFSATLDGDVDKLVKRYLRSPVTHSTAPPSAAVATMSHHLLFVHKADKRDVVAEIASRDGLTILFVRTKHGADRLAKQLRAAGVAAGALHGGKAQNNRTRTLAAFADGSVPVLVTTDVAARGIHVDGISLVVHVDPPAEPKAYLHRAGRTARAGEDGVVVTLVTEVERTDVEKMTRKAGVDIEGVEVSPGDRRLAAITGARRPSGVPVTLPGATAVKSDGADERAASAGAKGNGRRGSAGAKSTGSRATTAAKSRGRAATAGTGSDGRRAAEATSGRRHTTGSTSHDETPSQGRRSRGNRSTTAAGRPPRAEGARSTESRSTATESARRSTADAHTTPSRRRTDTRDRIAPRSDGSAPAPRTRAGRRSADLTPTRDTTGQPRRRSSGQRRRPN
ncbi:Superfamily II DNA and RNA helicase [Nocardia amikacinitolerans]|uniref:Superfamily II DNA and RNA helicase n=1 Tax=Nocardia amikacinitolerans TaxID=756689 RepID=A0A285KT39_9NOCA|nr:Superfamily II DNA and RNA helicase [Nocardia amikacinitolerans]SNY75790.1 Superfamily II DNA and RNA helicase [Nocardia amikacinitolerans]